MASLSLKDFCQDDGVRKKNPGEKQTGSLSGGCYNGLAPGGTCSLCEQQTG